MWVGVILWGPWLEIDFFLNRCTIHLKTNHYTEAYCSHHSVCYIIARTYNVCIGRWKGGWWDQPPCDREGKLLFLMVFVVSLTQNLCVKEYRSHLQISKRLFIIHILRHMDSQKECYPKAATHDDMIWWRNAGSPCWKRNMLLSVSSQFSYWRPDLWLPSKHSQPPTSFHLSIWPYLSLYPLLLLPHSPHHLLARRSNRREKYWV